MLAVNGFDIFPKWQDINEYQKSITPEIHHLQSPFTGVRFDFLLAFEVTTKRLVEAVKLNGTKLDVKIKYGIVGSGSHSIYHQKNNINTNNIILSIFCPLEVTSKNPDEVWTEPSPNTPNTQ